ncbi:hypothetical protein OG422_17775 [Streptomyces sp. NBC_01525]|uniref:hypothetical protein n=1 Tax=Streptomyces sp. NBC_01525 TaxID=2903893 RepID=UPI0038653049
MTRNRLTTGGLTTGGAATAGVAALGLLLAGCHPGSEGVRSEGTPTTTAPAPGHAPSDDPSPTTGASLRKIDAVALLKGDPKVSGEVKRTLAKPCVADAYPIEVTYASLTGNKAPDVIVNVMTCADSIGIGAYVYRRSAAGGSGYDNVFSDEQPSVSAGVDKGDLEVSKQTYGTGDKVCCPSGEDVTTYRWSHNRFAELDRYHTDYSKTTVDGPGPDDDDTSEG